MKLSKRSICILVFTMGCLKTASSQDTITTKPIETINHLKAPDKLRLGVSGGWSRMTADNPKGTSIEHADYLKKLKTGFHAALDFTYYSWGDWGWGVRYSIFKGSNEKESVNYLSTTGQYRYGKMIDDITINFVGASIVKRTGPASEKINLIYGLSLGYIYLNNRATYVDPIPFTASTVGIRPELGIDLMVSKNLAIGINANYVLGMINQIRFESQNESSAMRQRKGDLETISHFNIGLGLKWIK